MEKVQLGLFETAIASSEKKEEKNIPKNSGAKSFSIFNEISVETVASGLKLLLKKTLFYSRVVERPPI